MPDPLEPAHIPGQNPATPERMRGQTRSPDPRRRWMLFLIAALIGVAALYVLGVIGH